MYQVLVAAVLCGCMALSRSQCIGPCNPGNTCQSGYTCSSSGECCKDNCKATGPCIGPGGTSCPTGQTCLSGECCQVPACVSLGPCSTGDQCPTNSVCVNGECCGVCGALGACVNGECPSGYVCTGNQCRKYCSTNSCSGSCTLTASTIDCSCCPCGGVWNEWSSWSTCSGAACNTCGTITRNRICASDACQCPCEGPTSEEQSCTVTGVWSAWSSPSACNDTCGACGVSTQTRTCTTPSCPCTGASTLTTSCGLTPCVYPKHSCCSPYSAGVYNENIQCGPIPASPTDAPPTSCNCCLVGGTWSEWASTGTCTDVCGSCGTIQQTRTCTSASSNCPCTGSTTRTIYCNIVPCQYPRNSCCNSMTAMSVNGAIICGPQPSYADLTPVTSGCLPTGCCPSEGVWSTWSSPSACNDTCGSCGVITRTRTCMTTTNGCPCTGDSTMYTPCATKPCTYPRMSCCGTYKAMAVRGQHICGPLPANTIDEPPGPLTCAAVR
uniref:Uncharacterized protein n=1 Tax=Acrobeloides nanus TaxID=290746 RepID=A0A914CUF6_9BILA